MELTLILENDQKRPKMSDLFLQMKLKWYMSCIQN